MKKTALIVAAAVALLAGRDVHVLGIHSPSARIAAQRRMAEGGMRGGGLSLGGGGHGSSEQRRRLRLRGGGMSEDDEDSEDTRPKFKGTGAKLAADEDAAAAASASANTVLKEAEAVGSGMEDEGEEAAEKGDEAAHEEEAEVEKAPIEPEMVRKMNKMLWEAAMDGNEPLVDKALKNGANVNAFMRGPDKWLNISVGEIAGADEGSTGLNCHWMELNNYTALHLAAASGNAGIIDKLVEAGADINAECLQRVHPMPTSFGIKLPIFSTPEPIVYKCTALRLARAANCGRCFFTSYAKGIDKLVDYGAIDNDFHFPLNTVILGGAFLLAYMGINKWPFDWFREWPDDWANYPDMAEYGQQR